MVFWHTFVSVCQKLEKCLTWLCWCVHTHTHTEQRRNNLLPPLPSSTQWQHWSWAWSRQAWNRSWASTSMLSTLSPVLLLLKRPPHIISQRIAPIIRRPPGSAACQVPKVAQGKDLQRMLWMLRKLCNSFPSQSCSASIASQNHAFKKDVLHHYSRFCIITLDSRFSLGIKFIKPVKSNSTI